MLETRVIPTLLIKGSGLIKTTRFSKPVYIGDAINAIRIFNTKEVDELVLLDINASKDGRPPPFDMIRKIADECFMPLAYGGGITSIDHIRQILQIGVEKVVLNSAAFITPGLVRAAADEFGSQAVIVSVDVKSNLLRRQRVYSAGGAKVVIKDPVAWAREMQKLGAGEIFLTCVDRDGTMQGYDTDLISLVAHAVDIPVICSGGAGALDHFTAAHRAGASAVAAGAMFVFQGPLRAVLITYPARADIKRCLAAADH
jgi:cyclase